MTRMVAVQNLLLLVCCWAKRRHVEALSTSASPTSLRMSWAVDDAPVGYQEASTDTEKRRPIMAGNWKLNPATLPEAKNLLKLLASNFINHRIPSGGAIGMPEVVVFPPFPFLKAALQQLEGSGIKVGAQNVGLYETGAYTGEISASMVSSMGCDYVMLGHSERRTLFGESDDTINAKVHLCLAEPNLSVILCVGETEEGIRK